jgi:DNA-binding response OmpR family regulator
MTKKILVADDSATIRKVIHITLANEDYELIDCDSDQELLKSIKSDYDLLLLDFNLSDSMPGLVLASKIREINSSVPILMLYGAFDSIDEHALNDLNITDKIVKPFDSTKFINLCRAIIDTNCSSIIVEKDLEDKTEIETENSTNDDLDQWTMNSHQADALEKFDNEEGDGEGVDVDSSSDQENELTSSMADWGMDVPGVIDGSKKIEVLEKPDVIKEDAGDDEFDTDKTEAFVMSDLDLKVEEDISDDEADQTLSSLDQIPGKDDLEYPSDNDLEYPAESDLEYPGDDIDAGTERGELEFSAETEADTDDSTKESSVPQFTSLDDLDQEEELLVDDDIVNENEIDSQKSAEKEEILEQKIEAEISPDDFWSTDELDTSTQNIVNDSVDGELDSVSTNEQSVLEEEVDLVSNIDIEEIKNKIESQIKDQIAPMIEKMVREYCQERVDKVAWEIIPDLAENIIKDELDKLADSVEE